MNLVLDSSALIALFRKEEGAEVVRDLLDNPVNNCVIHAVNLCEVYYGFRRNDGKLAGERMMQVVEKMAVVVREDMDASFWQQAGRYKADLGRLSLADCFCLALASRINGELITSDRHEMEKLADNNLVNIRFIR